MSEKTTMKENSDGDLNEIYQEPAKIIKYFGGIPHVQIVINSRGYAGSERIIKFWRPIGRIPDRK